MNYEPYRICKGFSELSGAQIIKKKPKEVCQKMIWRNSQGLEKGAVLCFRNLYFYFRHGESTSTASQLTSPASQKSKDFNEIPLLLQDLGSSNFTYCSVK